MSDDPHPAGAAAPDLAAIRADTEDAWPSFRKAVLELCDAYDAQAERLDRAERYLLDLTPGGSEFYGNPERCFAWAKERASQSLQAAVKAKAELRSARAALAQTEAEAAALRGALDRCVLTVENVADLDRRLAKDEAAMVQSVVDMARAALAPGAEPTTRPAPLSVEEQGLLEALEKAERYLGLEQHRTLLLRADLAAAVRRADQMQPVVDAALEWGKWGEIANRSERAALLVAVDAYRAALGLAGGEGESQ